MMRAFFRPRVNLRFYITLKLNIFKQKLHFFTILFNFMQKTQFLIIYNQSTEYSFKHIIKLTPRTIISGLADLLF